MMHNESIRFSSNLQLLRFLGSEAAGRRGRGSPDARRVGAVGSLGARSWDYARDAAAAVPLGLLSGAAALEEARLYALGTLPLLARATRNATPKCPYSRCPAAGPRAPAPRAPGPCSPVH